METIKVTTESRSVERDEDGRRFYRDESGRKHYEPSGPKQKVVFHRVDYSEEDADLRNPD